MVPCQPVPSVMTFAVCDERVLTKGKNRSGGIPEGKGACAPYVHLNRALC